jgi:hypothetical protein
VGAFQASVPAAPTVTTQPANQTVTAGHTATFTAAAAGSPAPTVVWEVSTDGGATYSPVAGATSATLTFTAAANQNGNRYEAVFTNTFGSATTTAAALTVQTVPVFTSRTPTAAVTAGQNYRFTFAASGNPAPQLSASNLPPWLTFDAAAGVLSGSSTTAMTYANLKVVATNAAGSATQTFTVIVAPADASRLVVTIPPDVTTGTPTTVTVTAVDPFGNVATNYGGTVHFSSSDPAAALPADAPLPGGSASFTVTFRTPGSQTLTVTATAGPALGGASAAFPVSTTPDRVAVFDQITGAWYLDNQGTGNFTPPGDASFHFGHTGDTAVVGDWNGAGFDEVGVYRLDLDVTDPATGLHPLLFSLDVNGNNIWDPAGGDVAFDFGLQGDKVVVGDWTGAGKDEIGVVRPGSDGALVWSLNLRSGDSGNYAVYHFGFKGDVPVVGDWSGAGKSEIGTARSAGGALSWSLDYNGDGVWEGSPVDRAYLFGNAGDLPLVGTWNGGSKAMIGTARAGGDALLWSLDYNGNGIWDGPGGGDRLYSFGTRSDAPLVGDWVGNGSSRIGSFMLNQAAQALLFSLDSNGDGLLDAGDVVSQSGFPGGATSQVLVGRWKNAAS